MPVTTTASVLYLCHIIRWIGSLHDLLASLVMFWNSVKEKTVGWYWVISYCRKNFYGICTLFPLNTSMQRTDRRTDGFGMAVARSALALLCWARQAPNRLGIIIIITRTVLTGRVSSYGLPAWVSSELGPMGGTTFTTSAAALEPGHY